MTTAGDGSDAISGRYKDAYSVARSIVSWGDSVKVMGVVVAIVIALLGFVVGSTFGPILMVVFLVLGAAVGAAFYFFGVMIAAQGQVLQAILDTAVNTSPLLSVEQKRGVIAVSASQKIDQALNLSDLSLEIKKLRDSGNSAFLSGDYEGALADFRKVLGLVPKAPHTHFKMACIYSMQENASNAFAQVSQAVESGFNDFDKIRSSKELDYLRKQPSFENFAQNGYRLKDSPGDK